MKIRNSSVFNAEKGADIMSVEYTNRTVCKAKFVEATIDSLREVQKTMKYFPKHWNLTNNVFIVGLAFDAYQKADSANDIYSRTAWQQIRKVNLLSTAHSDITSIIRLFASFMVDQPRSLGNAKNASTGKDTMPMKKCSNPADNYVVAMPLRKLRIISEKLNETAKLLNGAIKYEMDNYVKFYARPGEIVDLNSKNNNVPAANITDAVAQAMTTNTATPQVAIKRVDNTVIWQPQTIE